MHQVKEVIYPGVHFAKINILFPSVYYTTVTLIAFRFFLFKLLFSSEVGGGCKIRLRRNTVMPVEASSIPKIYLLRQMKSESVDPSEMF